LGAVLYACACDLVVEEAEEREAEMV